MVPGVGGVAASGAGRQGTQLTQALLNLVANAFESVCHSEGPREVVLRADQEPNQVHVSVRDSGKGIDAKVIPNFSSRLFTRPNRAAWAWASLSFVQSSRIMEAGFG